MVPENSGDMWDDVFGGDEDEGKSKKREGKGQGFFLRLNLREEPYRIRPVEKPVFFNKHFVAFKYLPEKSNRYPISPAFSDEEKHKDAAWDKGKYLPSKRYAMPVIDREDGKVRILEAGPSVFNVFRKYIQMTKSNPASKESGLDWLIQVSRDERGGVAYSCMPDPTGPKPLTETEDKEVQSFIANLEKFTQEKYGSSLGWKYYFQPITEERMHELWMSLPEDKRVRKFTPKGQQGSQQRQAPKTEDKPASKPAEKSVQKTAEAPATAKAEEKQEAFMQDDENLPVTGGDDSSPEASAEEDATSFF